MKNYSKSWRRAAAWVCAAVLCFSASGAAQTVSAIRVTPVETTTQRAESLLTRDVICQNQSGVNYWTSEHFQFIWGNSGADSGKITQEFLEGNARHLEAAYDVYMNELYMIPPTQSTNEYLRDGNEYKVNIYLSGTGLEAFTDDWAYMSVDAEGFGYIFACVGAMAYDTPSWVMPHEFAHVVTEHQLGWGGGRNKYTYAWYEVWGNWFREQFLYSDYYAPYVDSVGGTDYFETYMKNLCFTFPFGRDYYAAWPFLQYLKENPDNLEGYGAQFISTLLQKGERDEYPLDMIDRLAEADMKDTLGHFAKRMATLDFEQQERYRARQNQLFSTGQWNWGEIYTILDQSTDNPDYYTVPTERAPQHAGINLIPLQPTGDTITVTLEGLVDDPAADWRACIVVEDRDGSTRYSDLFSSGQTMEMFWDSSRDAQAYLTIAATPDTESFEAVGLPYGPDSEFAETNYPFSSKARYPYAVTITGAEMQQSRQEGAAGYGNYHPNGGGFVAATAHVDESVYVGPDARVLDYATVTGNAVITDYATVCGSATVSGNAIVSGHAVVAENATVQDNAIVSDSAGVMGNATVSGNGRVIESGLIYNDYRVDMDATVKGVAFCMANGYLTEQAIADGDYYDDASKTVKAGTVYGWVSSESYTSSRPFTQYMMAGLEFTEDTGRTVQDTYTSTYGVMQGGPLWEDRRTSANGVMTFNGDGQYMIADSSYANLREFCVETAVLWRGAGDQRIFSFGDDEKYVYLTTEGESGAIELVMNDGTGEQRLASYRAMNLGEWYVISASVVLGRVQLSVRGMDGDTYTMESTTQMEVCDVVSESARYYVARGYEGNAFNGSMDYFRVLLQPSTDLNYAYSETEDIELSDTVLIGDLTMDNEIDVFDLGKLKSVVLKDDYHVAGDCDRNGDISVTDIIALQQYLFGYGNGYIGTYVMFE